jgi:hypothetical protein
MKLFLLFFGFSFMLNSMASDIKKIDPEVIKVIDKMGAYLRSLKDFRVTSDFTFDVVLEDNQKIQSPGSLDYQVKRPHGLFADLKTDDKHRQYFYDGSTFTIYDPTLKFYGQLPAPDSLGAVIEKLEDKYGIEFPLAELFEWGDKKVKAKRITSAMHITESQINQEKTDQYAIRQGDVDWQIWITQGDKPLPKKMILTFNSDPMRPQFISQLTWGKIEMKDFKFNPSKDASKIEISPAREEKMMQQEGKE